MCILWLLVVVAIVAAFVFYRRGGWVVEAMSRFVRVQEPQEALTWRPVTEL